MLVNNACFSCWPNAQACFTSKIGNVCQAMLVRLAGASQLIWRLGLKPLPNGQTLFGKHFEVGLSSILVRLATTTKIARQAHFACQCFCNISKTFLLVTSRQCLSEHMFVWCPNQQTFCLANKSSNVCQTMSFRLAGA